MSIWNNPFGETCQLGRVYYPGYWTVEGSDHTVIKKMHIILITGKGLGFTVLVSY